jgi:hypothetical protein
MKHHIKIPNSFIIMLAFVILASSAQAWVQPHWQNENNYVNAVNISVNNWAYTAVYGANVYTQNATHYALIYMNNSGNQFLYTIRGYDGSGFDVGDIKYNLVRFVGGNSVIIIKDTTDSGLRWYSATIFYNPLNQSLALNGGSIEKNASLNPVFHLDTSAFINGSARIFPNATFNLGLNKLPFFNGAMVALANTSIVNENFSFNFYPDYANRFLIYSHNGVYALKDQGTLTSEVTSAGINSINGQKIFGNNGVNFEAYFSITSNQVLSEQMGANEVASQIFNTTDTRFTTSGVSVCGHNTGALFTGLIPLPCPTPAMQFRIKTANEISFLYLPAFTSNYVKGNVVTNSAPSGGSNPLNFRNHVFISNIVWQNNFITNAYPSNTNTPFAITHGIASTPFLLITLPHYDGMGRSCYNIYLQGTTANTLINFGSVPFSLFSCSDSEVKLLIQNTTSLAFLFNYLLVYYNSPTNSGGFDTPAVMNNYLIGRGNHLSINYGGNVPLMVDLSSPLNFNSYISMGNDRNPASPELANFSYNGLEYISGNYFANSGRNGNLIDFDVAGYTLHNTKILIDERGGSYPALFTQTLAINSLNSGANCISACVALYNISANTYSSGGAGSDTRTGFPFGGSFNIILANPLTANVHRLYTTTYNKSDVIFDNQSTLTNRTLPHTPFHLNFNTTTINYRTQFNQTIIFLPNLGLKQWELGILFIFILIIAAFVTHVKENIGITIILIGLWLMGIFYQAQILILALILSVVFLFYEYNEFVHREQRAAVGR